MQEIKKVVAFQKKNSQSFLLPEIQNNGKELNIIEKNIECSLKIKEKKILENNWANSHGRQCFINILNVSNKKVIIENYIKNKTHRIIFLKKYIDFKKNKTSFFFFFDNEMIIFDGLCGEIQCKLIFKQKNLRSFKKFKLSKNKEFFFLLKRNLVTFSIKKKSKKKEFRSFFKIKYSIFDQFLYILNHLGNILILNKKDFSIVNLVKIKFNYNFDFNIKKLLKSKHSALTVKLKKTQMFIFFFKQQNNSLFIRNPIAFGFRFLLPTIRIFIKKFSVFAILDFVEISIPIKINLNNLLHFKIIKYVNTKISGHQKFYSKAPKKLKSIEIKINKSLEPTHFLKQEKKDKGLLFKKFRTNNQISLRDHRYLIKLIGNFCKYKMRKKYFIRKFGSINIKNCLKGIPALILNPFLNFMLRNFFILKQDFFKKTIMIFEFFKFNLLFLQNNLFFYGFILEFYKFLDYKNYDLFLMKIYTSYTLRN